MPRNKTVRQLLAGLTLGAVVIVVVLLATCAAAPTQSPVSTTVESTTTAQPPQENAQTVETSPGVKPAHNPSDAACIVCHLRPASHGIDPFTCAECHSYPDWTTATHASSSNCSACHSKPAGHPSTGDQCSACHKNAGVNWRFQHPSSTNCADCHTAPAGHYGTDCNQCHSPSVPFADTRFVHGDGLNCADCHDRPHRAYPASCGTCHKNAGQSWKFAHPTTENCASCHTVPAGHYGDNCAACHTPSTAFAKTAMVHDDGTSDCVSCHTPPHRSNYPVNCSSCHPAAGIAWLPPVHTADTRCASCHTAPVPHYGTQCASCHNPAVPFADATIVHGPDTTECQNCHTPPHKAYPVACNSCHRSAGVSWVATHPAATTDCASCHTPPHRTDYPAACTSCHPRVGVAWVPTTHTDNENCSECHTRPVGHPAGECSTCHTPTIPWADTQHPGAKSDCASCHTPPHRADYPVACTSCHPQVGVAWVPPVHTADTGCASCHTAPAAHYGTNCASCHSPSVPFADATIVHGPEQAACQDCHTPPHKAYPVACNSCHQDAGVTWAVTHPASTSDCASCHATTDHPFAGLTCQDCHGEYHNDPDCLECHAAHGTEVFAGANCVSCHGLSAPKLMVTTGYDNFLFYWTAVTGATTYEIQRATNADFSSGRTVVYSGAYSTEVADSDSTLLPGTTYYYRARATMADGSAGAWSNILSPQLTAMTAPVATERAGGWDLVWTGGSADFFLMVNGVPTAPIGNPRTFYYKPPTPGSYVLAVRDSVGRVSPSVTVTSSGYVAALGQPTVTSEAGAYRLNWTGGAEPYTPVVDGATTATVEASTYLFDPNNGDYSLIIKDAEGARTDPIEVVKSADITFTPPAERTASGYVEYDPTATESSSTVTTGSVEPSKTMVASPETGQPATSHSGDPHVSVAEPGVPNVPRAFSATAKGHKARVSWADTHGVYYEVQQSHNVSFSEARIIWSGSANTAELGSFSAGDTVWLRVRERLGHDSKPSAWSAPVRVDFPNDKHSPSDPSTPTVDARIPDDEVAPKIEAPVPSDPQQPTVEPKPAADPPADLAPAVEPSVDTSSQ